ncbi:MAG TPA: GlsB/YeaQ/YmgE family stress response membrane protein [Nocardioidaceae bacterium]|jgi:uncharacterized membrane protein YeaQ/YmgE (transglycosylase-associated protein family)
MELIGLIIGGVVIGLLGKLVAPKGKDDIPWWGVIVCGVGGILIGDIIYVAFGGNGSPGIDWTRWIVAVLVSAGLVVIASAMFGRRTTTKV